MDTVVVCQLAIRKRILAPDSVSEQQEDKSNAGTGANGNTSQLRPRSRGPGGACPPIFLKF